MFVLRPVITSKNDENLGMPMNSPGDVNKTVKDEPASSKADLFNWMKGSSSSIFSMVAEKAKNSVDAVLTTLDPQMKDAFNRKWTKIENLIKLCRLISYYLSNIYVLANIFDNCDVVVASEKEIVVSAVREGFQKVFGKAVVR